ncbi:DNA internalization-related competence protein ComEC/Rec2 [Fructobacillus sp. W13]|uniref:DNA internalization-related competence protein ComEC/Rec2 n=1 Tax=Fructobacillus apis TaxID=2935017 RepID=A0ABT0ZNY6_9LACO|nr:DNA internalization-related competence protein ComEC/Rec2 [Fructobacillus apis]MCO0831714.1 DNA internalization-related competence protein ComEC/Rec2 [Fructobacillus apis]
MSVGEGRYQLTVLPDDYEINDEGVIRGRGRNEKGQVVLFQYRTRGQADLDTFLQEDATLQVMGNGDFQRITPATNDYQFDWAAFMETRRITHQIHFNDLTVKRAQPKNFWQVLLFAMRSWHAKAATWTNQLPSPLGNYTKTLLLGAKSEELYAENPKIQELGLVHLFSLSGLHVGFLLASLMRLGQRLRIFKEITCGVQAVALPIFYLFTGAPPVLVRAVVAGETRLVKERFGTVIEGEVIWAWSLMGALLVTPQILLTLGGQLSFGLTLALTFAKDLDFWKQGLFLSVVAFPILIAQQYGWNCWHTLANLIGVPVFMAVVMPAVLLNVALGWLPGLLLFANFAVWLFDRAIYWLGMLPGYVVLGAFCWPVLVALFLLPFFFFGKGRRVKVALGVIYFLLFSGNFLAVKLNRSGEFTTFDVGQGDAAALIEPFKKSVTVIDTGGRVSFGRPRKLNLRERRPKKGSDKAECLKEQKRKEGQARTVILPYLHARGISKIDTLSLSHQDQDHIGDARVILENFRVKQLVVPAGMEDGPAFQKKVRPYLRRTKVISATNKVKVKNCPLKVLYPFNRGEAKNEDSLAWGGKIGNLILFSAGDLDRPGEKRVVAQYPNFYPEVVKFGHHGSKTATCPVVFAKWKPKYGIVSAGRHSRYGHPHPETLATAQKEHMIVFSTQRQGMLRYVYNTNHAHFEVTLKHDPFGP